MLSEINKEVDRKTIDVVSRVLTALDEKHLPLTPLMEASLYRVAKMGIVKYKDDKDFSEDSLVGMLVWAIEIDNRNKGGKND